MKLNSFMLYLVSCPLFILNSVLILPHIHSHTFASIKIVFVWGRGEVKKCLYFIKCLCDKCMTIIDIKIISFMFQTNYFIAYTFLFAIHTNVLTDSFN